MQPNNHKCVIGLIGGIGSGKSQVAAELKRHGAAIINADHLGHQALDQSDVKTQLIDLFGAAIYSAEGSIDRKKVAAIVFSDEDKRRQLESVVFPLIESGIEEQIERANHDPNVRWIVLDAAILLESGWDRRCDVIVYVHAPRSIRLERLISNRGWKEKEVRQRSDAQLSLTDKITRAHFVVDNSGSIPELSERVGRMVERLEELGCCGDL